MDPISLVNVDREIQALSKDVDVVKLVTELTDSTVEVKKERIEKSLEASQGNAGKIWQKSQ